MFLAATKCCSFDRVIIIRKNGAVSCVGINFHSRIATRPLDTGSLQTELRVRGTLSSKKTKGVVYSYSCHLTLPLLERTPGLWPLLCFYRKTLCTTKCDVGWNNKQTRHISVWVHSEKIAHLYSNYSSNLILCLHQHLHKILLIHWYWFHSKMEWFRNQFRFRNWASPIESI